MAPHLFYFHFPLQITKIVLLFFFSWNIRRFEIFKREFEWSMMTSKQAQSFSTLSYHRALHCIGHWTPLIHCQGIVEISGIPAIYGLNTSYLTDSYIIFTLKMESESKITIFGLKMMVKSGLKTYFWNSSMQETTFPHFIKVPKITNSVVKITIFPHGGISK